MNAGLDMKNEQQEIMNQHQKKAAKSSSKKRTKMNLKPAQTMKKRNRTSKQMKLSRMKFLRHAQPLLVDLLLLQIQLSGLLSRLY